MHIAVILRLNPVLTDELELTEGGKDIDREWIGFELNPMDDQALEQSVLLKEAHGAKVTAIAAEAEGGERLLRTALARGVDDVLLISNKKDDDAPPPSSRARTPLLVEAIKQVKPDLVITGILSTDDLYGELAPQLAACLNWPQASAVSDVRLDGMVLTVRQEYAGGMAALIEMDLPAVIGLQTAASPPRYVAGSKLRDLLNTKVPEMEASAEFAEDLSEATTLNLPDTSGGAEMIEGDAKSVAARIHEILMERGLV
ncbi:electron transfer flavoprotein subunit beta/FixA family protein [Pseudaminobacter arsenicus]|uniref:Electron transfer flavoprotein subunit beta/FixA family protein n=1 Tax=Borborobacter arsenicus TaxID=1851146 RepID=A0A432VBE5_9HYPH|nr:electron transfer flavoprotein subunit beta/FixA family protein [Pseudaminobacter arsenicus]RUM99490.1 electron transfer flavoprotein subunit beta/FixA family protein [Pseudaminobacter arsenicus]